MARSSFLQSLRQIVLDNHVAERQNRPVEELREERARVTRRNFLAGAAATVAATVVGCNVAMEPHLGKQRQLLRGGGPRIAIIGGGIAGLTAALELADAGLSSTIYEALPNRFGGRMLTDRSGRTACGACHTVSQKVSDTWLDGQSSDVFGEMIDSDHPVMISLAKRFNLPLVDMLGAEPVGSTTTYYFDGGYYTPAEIEKDYLQVRPALKADAVAAGYPTSFERSTAAGRALDAMSIYDWIETRVPGGHRSRFGKLLDVAYNIEFGAECTDQSSLSLLYLLAYGHPRRFDVFGTSDERYRIGGGIDRIPTAITEHLQSVGVSMNLGSWMESLSLRSDGSYNLYFEKQRQPVVADVVVLTLPFAVLKNLDYSQAGFDLRKNKAIQELGEGRNAKLQMQFSNRYWNTSGPWGVGNGSSYSDTGFQNVWETTRGQLGQSGILVDYTGGDVTLAMKLKHPYATYTDANVISESKIFLSRLEPVYPGISAFWNGRAAAAMPHTSPTFRCSYSYWRVGQYQTIAGYERVRQGNVFFAGEHTSLDFRGWMEGAASEGVRVGKEIVSSLKSNKTASLFQPGKIQQV